MNKYKMSILTELCPQMLDFIIEAENAIECRHKSAWFSTEKTVRV